MLVDPEQKALPQLAPPHCGSQCNLKPVYHSSGGVTVLLHQALAEQVLEQTNPLHLHNVGEPNIRNTSV